MRQIVIMKRIHYSNDDISRARRDSKVAQNYLRLRRLRSCSCYVYVCLCIVYVLWTLSLFTSRRAICNRHFNFVPQRDIVQGKLLLKLNWTINEDTVYMYKAVEGKLHCQMVKGYLFSEWLTEFSTMKKV